MEHDRRRVLVSLTDKAHVRQLAPRANLTTTKAFYLGSDCAAASQAILPASYAYKATHTTGCVVLVRDGAIVAHKACGGELSRVGARATPRVLRELCEFWLAHEFRGGSKGYEWAYSGVPHQLLAEELLPPPSAGIVSADDLKCWTVEGRTLYAQHVTARFAGDGSEVHGGVAAWLLGGAGAKRDTWYERGRVAPNLEISHGGWLGRMTWQPERNASRWLSARTLARAFRACDALASSAGIDFARVDLMVTAPMMAPSTGVAAGAAAASAEVAAEPRLVLNELTMYPMAGMPGLSPRSVDAKLAEAWCRGGGPHWTAARADNHAAVLAGGVRSSASTAATPLGRRTSSLHAAL